MINKYKQRIIELEATVQANECRLKELEWANVYHDSIRSFDFLHKVNIHPGRWAIGYPVFYVLTRILNDLKPKKIIEFGLGESSKIISLFLENILLESEQVIIEQSKEWTEVFQSRFKVSDRTTINHLPLETIQFKGLPNFRYKNFCREVDSKFDLYVVDGPHGSARYSRYDIVHAADLLSPNDQFVIIVDDTNRLGEQDTINALENLFAEKGISTHIGHFQGTKRASVVVSEKYKFVLSI